MGCKQTSKCEIEIAELERFSNTEEPTRISRSLKKLRKAIKAQIASTEDELDSFSLNAPNSYKLQVSIPANLNILMKAWAAAEGRDLSSVALQCLESGLRTMKSTGSIPAVAVKRYNLACEKRIALAELSNAWERHEELDLKGFI